jgi:hypothetical protein
MHINGKDKNYNMKVFFFCNNNMKVFGFAWWATVPTLCVFIVRNESFIPFSVGRSLLFNKSMEQTQFTKDYT